MGRLRNDAAALPLTAAACTAAGVALLAAAVAPYAVPLALGAATVLTFTAAAVVVLPRHRLALVLLVVVVVARLGSVLAPLGIPGAYVGVLALATLSALWGLRSKRLRLPASPVFPALLLLVGVRALSLLVARDEAAALAAVRDSVAAVLFLTVVCALASAPGGLRALVLSAGATVTVLAGLSVVQEVVLGNAWDIGGLSRVGEGPELGGATARHSGPLDDPNQWGRVLVLMLPLALLPWWTAPSGRARWAVAASGVCVLSGIYLTQSRGALLAAAVALAVWLPLIARRPGRALIVLLAALAALAVVPGVGSRLSTLADASEAAAGGGDPSLVGRAGVLRHGVAMFLDHPLLGVGAGNFVAADAEYRLRETTYAGPLAAHNLFLEILAETGVVGGVAWLLFLGCLVRAALHVQRRARGPDAAVGAAVLAGLAGWATASIFLHLNELRLLLLVAAVAVTAEAATPARPAPAVTRTSTSAPGSVLALSWAVAAGAVAVLLAGVVDLRRPSWEASQSARVMAAGAGAGDRYEHDLATRPFLAQTFAAIAQDAAVRRFGDVSRAETTAPSYAALVVVEVQGASAATAAAGAEQVMADVRRVLRRSGSAYVLQPVSPSATVVRQYTVLPAGAAAVVTTAVLLVAPPVIRRTRRRPPAGSAR